MPFVSAGDTSTFAGYAHPGNTQVTCLLLVSMSTSSITQHHPVPTRTADIQAHSIDDSECRLFREAAELAGKKWTAATLLALARGAERFSEIAASIEGISDRLLSARLRELEAQGLVERVVIPSTPVQIRYKLTDSGSDLIRILHPLVQWAKRSSAASDAGSTTA